MDDSSSSASSANGGSVASRLRRPVQVLVVSSVMFTFISYWRTAAIVLCDMSSTVYYIGAIVETAIGKAAPWFIIGVLLFSYAMRAVYIESSALFVRGGVYRVVKQAGVAVLGKRAGGLIAKLSVSAILFDYILTGPISGVSAGQYIVGLGLEGVGHFAGISIDEGTRQAIKSLGSVLIACGITLYFFRQNLIGIPESSDKALKIMIATTVMGVVMLVWCGVTLAVKGPVNPIPSAKPDLHKKVEIDRSGQEVPRINPATGEQEDPLGFIGHAPSLAEPLRDPANWLSLVGILGVIIAFGHSILAMSGEETLAQVYREVESPKLKNFKKAAFLVFIYSLLLTGIMNFLAVMLIPDDLRMKEYYDNWIGGLAMQMVGPLEARLLLNAFVVVVGFLILSGAVNTSIVGSNAVLSRVAEDGVLPDWFLRPHRRYGTTYRVLWVITGLQLFTIVVSRGDVILLGEAYAFGVVWSFVLKTLAMIVLRAADRSPREFKVPLNVRLGKVEVPVGLTMIFVVVFLSAVANLLTKQVATISGMAFTAAFLAVFVVTERFHEKRRGGAKHEHVEQFNQRVTEEVSVQGLGLTKPFRKLVAIRSTNNLFMLERALAETDPDTTDVVVMTARVMRGGESSTTRLDLEQYDRELMTAVVTRAEKSGKSVQPLILATNNPLHAVVRTAKDIEAQELVLGTSNVYTADDQVDQIAFYWIELHGGDPRPLTVRLLSQTRDISFDLAGGNRIPKIGERKARSVAELRSAGVGVRHVLLVHDGTPEGSDLFLAALTMLDPEVALTIVPLAADPFSPPDPARVERDLERTRRLKREIDLRRVPHGEPTAHLVDFAAEIRCDLIALRMTEKPHPGEPSALDLDLLLRSAPCRVCLVASPRVPDEVAG